MSQRQTRQQVLESLRRLDDHGNLGGPELNVVVLGGGGVGKSALTIRLVTDNFLDEYDPTIEDSYRKLAEIDDDRILLDLLDTAGQEEFSSMQDQWMREGQAFLIVYSITSKSTFDQAVSLYNKILRTKEDAIDDWGAVPIILVAAKCDLNNVRQVTTEEGEALAETWGAPFFETSAKHKINNIRCFYEAFREYMKIHTSQGTSNASSPRQRTAAKCNCDVKKCGKKCGKVMLTGCIGFVYFFLLGCVVHLLYLCCKKIYDGGYCKCDCDCTMKGNDGENGGASAKRRHELRLLFPKVDHVEEDTVRQPILSLKNFKIHRRFSCGRFIKSLLCGQFLPLVILFETGVFLTYTDKHSPFYYDFFYPMSYEYDKIHKSLLLDLLGAVVGRQANEDPDAVKDRAWFLKQSTWQNFQRVIITILLCLTFLICYYNIWEAQNNDLRVSLMESAGPLSLFWIIWLLLSCWIAYESKLKPPMPSTYRLRSIKLYLGERYTHMTDANKFLRAYAWSRNKKWTLRTLHTSIIILLGLIYALIPSITRATVGDTSDGLESKTFITKQEWMVEVGAIIVNFMLVASFIYAIEVQYSKHFDNYREWMYDLTMLLNKTTTNKSVITDATKSEHYMPQKGRNFSKDLFVSLTRKSNALGWLEIRSFLAAEGKLLFAEQELPTLWILLLTIAISMYLLYRVFFITSNPLQSILFNGASMLCIICLLSLIRIAITGYQFEAIQKTQERLLGEQRFFMRCSETHKVVIDNDAKLKPAAIKLKAPPNKSESKESDFMATEIELASNHDSKQAEKDNVALITPDGNNSKGIFNVAAIMKGSVQMTRGETAGNEEEVKENNTVIAIDENEDQVMDEKESEMQPLLRKDEDVLSKIEMNVVNMSNYMIADQFGFIDNMLFIVERKDIFPRLFRVKLNSVLAKAIAGIIISVVAAVVKLLY